MSYRVAWFMDWQNIASEELGVLTALDNALVLLADDALENVTTFDKVSHANHLISVCVVVCYQI